MGVQPAPSCADYPGSSMVSNGFTAYGPAYDNCIYYMDHYVQCTYTCQDWGYSSVVAGEYCLNAHPPYPEGWWQMICCCTN